MQRGPDREPLTKDDLAALTSAAFTNLMAGKVKETAALFCAASAAAKYGQHTGDIETVSTPRWVECGLGILENRRRYGGSALLVAKPAACRAATLAVVPKAKKSAPRAKGKAPAKKGKRRAA